MKRIRSELLQALDRMQADLGRLRELAEELPDGQWLTTQQVALLKGIKTKTVSNYASKGRFKKIKRSGGRWLIHIDELDRL